MRRTVIHVSDPEVATNRICLLIADADTDTDAMLRFLGDSVPVQILRWQDEDYLETIHQLRPAVVVASAATLEMAYDSAALVAALVTTFCPTIVGLALSTEGKPKLQLQVYQLGAGAVVTLVSLADLDFSFA
jgi:hypothetical protein